MILKLNTNGTITVKPTAVPESMDHIVLSYEYPQGLAHLEPVLHWGFQKYYGDDIIISKKADNNYQMRVVLYDNGMLYKTYNLVVANPELYIGYGINTIRPNILEYIAQLEKENKALKERGDVV